MLLNCVCGVWFIGDEMFVLSEFVLLMCKLIGVLFL